MKRKPRVGDVVAVYFDDHSSNHPDDEVLSFIVWGRVSVVTANTITVDSWAHENPTTDRGKPGDEIESFTMVWPAVTKVVQIVEEIDE